MKQNMNYTKRKDTRVVIFRPVDSRRTFGSHASPSTYTNVSTSITRSTIHIRSPNPVVKINGIHGYGRAASGESSSHSISISEESTLLPPRFGFKGNTSEEHNSYYSTAPNSTILSTPNRHDVNYLLNPTTGSALGKSGNVQGRESPKNLFRSSRAGTPLQKHFHSDRLLSLAIRQPTSLPLNLNDIEDDISLEREKLLAENEPEMSKNENCLIPCFETDSNFRDNEMPAPNGLVPVDIEDDEMILIEETEVPDEPEEEYEEIISVGAGRKRKRSGTTRSSTSYISSPSCSKKKRRRWQFDEQQALRLGVEKHGDTAWDKVSKYMTDMGCKRTPKQCRERYRNHDSSVLKNVRIWTEAEDNAIRSLYKLYPKQWAKISKDYRLNGRAPVHIRNRFNWKLKDPRM